MFLKFGAIATIVLLVGYSNLMGEQPTTEKAKEEKEKSALRRARILVLKGILAGERLVFNGKKVSDRDFPKALEDLELNADQKKKIVAAFDKAKKDRQSHSPLIDKINSGKATEKEIEEYLRITAKIADDEASSILDILTEPQIMQLFKK